MKPIWKSLFVALALGATPLLAGAPLQPAQAQAVAADDLQLRAHPRGSVSQLTLQFLHRSHDQGQRSAELVADIGE